MAKDYVVEVVDTTTGKVVKVNVSKEVYDFEQRDAEKAKKRIKRLCRCRVDGVRCTKSDEECQRCHWFITGKQNGGVDSLEYLEEELGLEPKAASEEMEILMYALLLEQLLEDVDGELKFIARELFEGYTEQEIADGLGKSRNTVHSQIVKVRKILQSRYER